MIEMEYADGGTLAQLLSRQTRPLAERDILPMFAQITAAIRHMHQHNILHRCMSMPILRPSSPLMYRIISVLLVPSLSSMKLVVSSYLNT